MDIILVSSLISEVDLTWKVKQISCLVFKTSGISWALRMKAENKSPTHNTQHHNPFSIMG
jgi:hypothetical protein